MSRAKTTTPKKKRDDDRCRACHHLMRLHYFRRDGVECGRCRQTNCWSEKTGRQCRRCKHFASLHFIEARPPFCRIVGCDCEEFR